jgi:hypothetical protein
MAADELLTPQDSMTPRHKGRADRQTGGQRNQQQQGKGHFGGKGSESAWIIA